MIRVMRDFGRWHKIGGKGKELDVWVFGFIFKLLKKGDFEKRIFGHGPTWNEQPFP